jgi:hypothetical protein
MGRVARFRAGSFVLAATGLVTALAAAEPHGNVPQPPKVDAPSLSLTLFADQDDDDNNGVADGRQARVAGAAASDVRWIDLGHPQKLLSVEGSALRAIVGGRPLHGKLQSPRRVRRFGLQGVEGGAGEVRLSDLTVHVRVLELAAVDASGARIDLARSHASLSRVLPSELAAPGAPRDADALSWIAIGPPGSLPRSVSVRSTLPEGGKLDELSHVALSKTTCPLHTATGLACAGTPPIRVTSDRVDRSHPGSAARSLLGEVGGRIDVAAGGRTLASLRVGGPRESALGPIGRYRAHLRVRVVRLMRGGSAPIGGSTQGAIAVARHEVRTASRLWGQCGIHFGYGKLLDVQVVDPPPPHMLAIGCDLGLPASGGQIAFRAEKHVVKLQTHAGQTPIQVADALAASVRRAGLRALVSPNPRISPGALPTADVLVRTRRGKMIPLAPIAGSALSSDRTLRVCLGEVNLTDGLDHFDDFDAAAGTVEERALVKAFDDGDPTTIDVFIVPNFARTGRIGESFLSSPDASIRNTVIVDRAAVQAGARSYALAHELGHVLLDMPGHPDDYGVDHPSSLMDADAADPTIFGPRRLSVKECVRALRESGPGAAVPLLDKWPLFTRAK